MNRRSFLKFCGIAPVVPMVAVEGLSAVPNIGIAAMGGYTFPITKVVWHNLTKEQLAGVREVVKTVDTPPIISNLDQWKLFEYGLRSRNIPIPIPIRSNL